VTGARRTALGALAALAVALSGCDDDSDDTATTTTAPQPRPEATFQKVPDLPPGWKVHANRAGGFALGVPPGWKPNDRQASTQVRSFDRLVAVSITPDRTVEGLEIPLEDFATRTLAALPGFEGELDPGPSRRFKHRYNGIEVRAAGKAQTGVREQVRVVVLRRDHIVTFTAVMAVNAKPAAHASERLAERMLGTVRSRPIRGAKPRDESDDDAGRSQGRDKGDQRSGRSG
jgi:hypothetical protein